MLALIAQVQGMTAIASAIIIGGQRFGAVIKGVSFAF